MRIKMINRWGNVVIYATSEREKNRLLDKGFHIQEEPPAKAAAKPKKRKAGKSSEGKAD